MKKHIYIMTLFGLLLPILSSCNDDNENLFPDKYVKVLSLKDNSTKDLVMNTTQESITESILILKGGGNPDSEANVELRVLSKEETCAIWEYEPDQIDIIPSDAYEFVGGGNIKIGKDENHKYVSVTFYPFKIYSADKTNENSKWVLPLVLVSSTDTINQSMNKILIHCDVHTPLIEWNGMAEEPHNAEIFYKELKYPLSLNVAYSEDNTLDFTCRLVTTENEQLVADYNARMGTNYALLPANSYSVGEFVFNTGDKQSGTNLVLKREGLTTDQSYLLPLQLEVSTDLIEKTKDIKYLLVTNPKYIYQDIDRSSWKIAFCNTENGWGWDAQGLIDNTMTKVWTSQAGGGWNSDWPGKDDFYYEHNDAAHPYDYPLCLAKRPIGDGWSDMVIVVDMGESITLGGVGFGKFGEWGDRTLKHCEILVGEDFVFKTVRDGGSADNYNTVNEGNDWKVAFDCKDIPEGPGRGELSEEIVHWYTLSSNNTVVAEVQRGRYLKFHPMGTYNDNICACGLNELYAKKLVSIYGEPVE